MVKDTACLLNSTNVKQNLSFFLKNNTGNANMKWVNNIAAILCNFFLVITAIRMLK